MEKLITEPNRKTIALFFRRSFHLSIDNNRIGRRIFCGEQRKNTSRHTHTHTENPHALQQCVCVHVERDEQLMCSTFLTHSGSVTRFFGVVCVRASDHRKNAKNPHIFMIHFNDTISKENEGQIYLTIFLANECKAFAEKERRANQQKRRRNKRLILYPLNRYGTTNSHTHTRTQRTQQIESFLMSVIEKTFIRSQVTKAIQRTAERKSPKRKETYLNKWTKRIAFSCLVLFEVSTCALCTTAKKNNTKISDRSERPGN